MYGARILREVYAVFNNYHTNVYIVATRPTEPVKGVEVELGCKVHWIERGRSYNWQELRLPVPDLFIHTGWSAKHFMSLGDDCRRYGARVVIMIDNRWRGDIRQFIGSLYFRFFLRNKFSAVIVPGASGRKLMKYFGMEHNDIYLGMYGATTSVFPAGLPLNQRKNKILFVGQMITRKGLPEFAEALTAFMRSHSHVVVECIGNGPLEVLIRAIPGIDYTCFQQTDYVAKAMADSRFLILPSRDDTWGVVLHEAALSGCGLLCTSNVGAHQDLVSEANGRVFQPNNATSIYESLVWASELGEETLVQVGVESQRRAQEFGPLQWTKFFKKIVDRFLPPEDKHK